MTLTIAKKMFDAVDDVARIYAMLCRRRGGDAVPHMTKRRTCYAVDDVCEE